jgi:hypothetical protein
MSVAVVCVVLRVLKAADDLPFWAFSLAAALLLAGQVLCLFAPTGVRGKVLLGASIALNAAGLLAFPGSLLLVAAVPWEGWDEAISFQRPLEMLLTVLGLAAGCHLVAFALFVLFLKWLAVTLQDAGAGFRAKLVLALWLPLPLVLFAGMGAVYWRGVPAPGWISAFFISLLAALVAAFIAVLVYWHLLSRLKEAAARRAETSTLSARWAEPRS